METVEQIAQWVIDNRYPKSENEKVSDSEMYHELVESIAKLCTIPRVIKSVCPLCDGKGRRVFPNCNPPIDEVCPACKGQTVL